MPLQTYKLKDPAYLAKCCREQAANPGTFSGHSLVALLAAAANQLEEFDDILDERCQACRSPLADPGADLCHDCLMDDEQAREAGRQPLNAMAIETRAH